MPTKYTPAEVDKALMTLAYCGGNSHRAAELADIPAPTLREWRRETHRDRYLEIAEREGPKLEAIAAQQAREIIIRASETEHDVLGLLSDRIHEEEAPEPNRDDFPSDRLYELAYEAWIKRGSSKELSELAGTLQRITTSKGINGTKLLELTGRPTQITEHRSATDTLRSLAQRFPGLIVDADSVEIPNDQQALTSESIGANARSDH